MWVEYEAIDEEGWNDCVGLAPRAELRRITLRTLHPLRFFSLLQAVLSNMPFQELRFRSRLRRALDGAAERCKACGRVTA